MTEQQHRLVFFRPDLDAMARLRRRNSLLMVLAHPQADLRNHQAPAQHTWSELLNVSTSREPPMKPETDKAAIFPGTITIGVVVRLDCSRSRKPEKAAIVFGASGCPPPLR